MAITKKQAEQIEKRFMNEWKFYNLVDNDMKEAYRISLYECHDIMKILGYENNDFIRLKNTVLYDHDITLYRKYYEINQLVNEVNGGEMVFAYDSKTVRNIIDNFDYSIKYGSMVKQLYYIKQYEKEGQKIIEKLEKQIAMAIA